MDPKKQKERFKEYASRLSEEDKIAVVYDSDADGFSAGVIAVKSIEKIRGKKPDIVMVQDYKQSTISSNTIRKLKNSGIQKVFFIDMSAEQDIETLNKVLEFAEVVIFDHHKIYSNPDSEKVILLKSQFFSDLDGSKYPTAKLVYDFFSEITDLEDSGWIASIGIVGDMSSNEWKDFIDISIEKKGLTENDLEKYVSMIGSTITVQRESISELFDEFVETDNPKMLKLEKFEKFVKEVDEELGRVMEEFEKTAEIDEKAEVIFFMVESKFGVKSALINELSSKRFPEKTIIVMQKTDAGMVTLSARRQDFKVKMNELLELAVKDLRKSAAGGHIPAAGGIICVEDLETFKQRVIEILKCGKTQK